MVIASIWSQIPALGSNLEFAFAVSGIPALFAGLGLPYLYNRWIGPAISRKARLKKYLGILSVAAAQYAEEFPERFDDPETAWKTYGLEILELASKDLPATYDGEVMKEAKSEFLKYGAQALFKV